MANIFININNKSVVELTAKLEKMRKSDLPLAIRGTLNSAAFDVKQKTMPESASRFTNRKENFFKANSAVEMAQGFDVNSMRSTVGFSTQKANYNHAAVRELQEQEYGGKISNREFVPLDSSRQGGNDTEVRRKNRIENIGDSDNDASERIKKKAVWVKNEPGKTRKHKFVKAAIKAGKGGYVIGGLGKQMLYRIDSINLRRGKAKIKQTPLYSYSDGRSVKIKGTGFMRHASLKTGNRMEYLYYKEATRRFAKIK